MSQFLEKTKNVKMYDTLISENKLASKYDFIGSQPLQFQINNMTRMLSDNMCVTPKIDGVRYLMILGSSGIHFIDRTSTFYKIKNYTHQEKYPFDLLIDVEVYGGNGFLQIFMFDLLYVREKNKVNYIYRRPYSKRMEILYVYYLNFLSKSKNKDIKIYYKPYLQDFPFSYINEINDLYNIWTKFTKLPTNEIPKYDGLIFIDKTMPYFKFPSPSHGQYKWKPNGELTIDLKVNKVGKKYILLSREEKKFKEPFIKSSIDKVYTQDGDTFEFRLNDDGEKWEVVEDKGKREKGANSIITIRNVIEAYNNPVDFDSFIKFMKGNIGEMNWLCPLLQLKMNTLFGFKDVNFFTKEIGYDKFISGKMRYFGEVTSDFKRKSELMDKVDITKHESIFDRISSQISGKSTRFLTKTEFRVFIEFVKTYDSGFKKVKKTDENLFLMKKNIGEKLSDCYFLVNKLKNNPRIKLKYDKIFEYIDKKNDTYIYKYIDERYIFDKVIGKVKNKSENVCGCEELFGYNIVCNYQRYKSSKIDNYKIMRNPEEKLANISKKREKDVYTMKFDRYFSLKIVFVKESNKTKSFIEIELDINKYEEQNKNIIEDFNKKIHQTLKMLF